MIAICNLADNGECNLKVVERSQLGGIHGKVRQLYKEQARWHSTCSHRSPTGGGYVVMQEKVPELVVPSLEGCEVRGYITV